jgi:hypothetical protein
MENASDGDLFVTILDVEGETMTAKVSIASTVRLMDQSVVEIITA